MYRDEHEQRGVVFLPIQSPVRLPQEFKKIQQSEVVIKSLRDQLSVPQRNTGCEEMHQHLRYLPGVSDLPVPDAFCLSALQRRQGSFALFETQGAVVLSGRIDHQPRPGAGLQKERSDCPVI